MCLILWVEQRDHIVRQFMHIECNVVENILDFVPHSMCVCLCMYACCRLMSVHTEIGKRQITFRNKNFREWKKQLIHIAYQRRQSKAEQTMKEPKKRRPTEQTIVASVLIHSSHTKRTEEFRCIHVCLPSVNKEGSQRITKEARIYSLFECFLSVKLNMKHFCAEICYVSFFSLSISTINAIEKTIFGFVLNEFYWNENQNCKRILLKLQINNKIHAFFDNHFDLSTILIWKFVYFN